MQLPLLGPRVRLGRYVCPIGSPSAVRGGSHCSALSCTSYDPTKLTTTVTAGKPLWLFLDGIDGTKGTATVTVQITP